MSPDLSTENISPESTSSEKTDANDQIDGAERREFFRVEDRAVLRYCVVDTAALANTAPESHFNDGELFSLLHELRTIDRENHNVLRSISEQNRDIGQYLRAINRKIDLIAAAALTLDPHHAALAPQEISLSEGGLSLLATPKLAIGQFLAIELTLLPEQLNIACFGEVIAKRDEPPARSAIRFINLRETDRQLIAKHIFQVQIAARRQQQSALGSE